MPVVALNRQRRDPAPVPHAVMIKVVEIDAVPDDPEAALRQHLRDTQRLQTRMLRFQEDLVLATEGGFLNNPGVVINALQDLERTRASVARDLRATGETLNRIILERHRAGFSAHQLSH